MMRNVTVMIAAFVGLAGCERQGQAPESSEAAPESSDIVTVHGATRIGVPPSHQSEGAEAIAADIQSAGQGEYVDFPSVGLRLLRPDGFENAEAFYGFQQQSTSSSVMLSRIPGPFAEATAGFTSSRKLAAKGMTLRSAEKLEVDGKPGLLVSVTQTAYGIEFSKWMAVFGDTSETKMITATFPRSEEHALSVELKSAVLSAKSIEARPPSATEDIGFSITASDKMMLTESMVKALVYTSDGVIPASSPGEPFFIAGSSLSEIPIDDKRAFAVRRIFAIEHTNIFGVTSNEVVTIDGLDGIELIADGEDEDSGEQLAVYQVILFDETGYFLFQGVVGVEKSDEFLPEFRRMAHSFARTGD